MNSKKNTTKTYIGENEYYCLCTQKIKKSLIGPEDPSPQENIGDLILSAFKSSPDFIGQVDAETEENITFQQMRENSVKCALWLKKVSVKKGDTITICTRNPSVVYVPFLASIYIGAIVNPWDEKYFKDMRRVMYFLVINKPDVIFVDNDNFIQLIAAILILKETVIKIVTIGEFEPKLRLNSLKTILNDDFDKAEIDEFSCEQNNVMDIAIRTFSSAAVKYPGQANVPYIAFISPSNKQTPVMFFGDVGLWYGSLCWTHGPLLTVHAILSNVTVIKSVVFNEENLYKTIEKYKVTWMFFDTCNQLLEINNNIFRKYDMSSLKTILFDNWAMKYYIQKILVSLLPDISLIHVYSRPENGVIAYDDQVDNKEVSNAGYVVKNVQLLLLKKLFIIENKLGLLQLGPNKLGMICCKTPYIKRCSKHKKELWCYIGDGIHKDGKIFVFNNPKQILRFGNLPVFLELIEVMMQGHPAVSKVVVTERYDTDNDTGTDKHIQLVAYVETRTGKEVTKEELIQWLPEKLESCQLYGDYIYIYFITYEFPRLPNGKVDRERFQSMLKDYA